MFFCLFPLFVLFSVVCSPHHPNPLVKNRSLGETNSRRHRETRRRQEREAAERRSPSSFSCPLFASLSGGARDYNRGTALSLRAYPCGGRERRGGAGRREPSERIRICESQYGRALLWGFCLCLSTHGGRGRRGGNREAVAEGGPPSSPAKTTLPDGWR